MSYVISLLESLVENQTSQIKHMEADVDRYVKQHDRAIENLVQARSEKQETELAIKFLTENTRINDQTEATQ